MNVRKPICAILLALLTLCQAKAQGPPVMSVAAPYPQYAPAQYAPEQAPCQDCISHHCKLVPDVKQIKKTVYEVQEVPYCLKKLPPLFSFHRHGCDDCAECDCVRYKRVLVKKEIVVCEIPTTKCVPEPCVASACRTDK